MNLYEDIKENLKEDDINDELMTKNKKAELKLGKKIEQAIEILETARDTYRKESGIAVSGRYNSALSALRTEANHYNN